MTANVLKTIKPGTAISAARVMAIVDSEVVEDLEH